MAGGDDPSAALARAIEAVVAGAVAGSTPPPRGLPYLGLDHPSGTRLELLDDLAGRGIFRKYERVLDLGGGLGATTRYLAARLGCSATATAATAAEAAAAARLTLRARLGARATHVAADPARLPFATSAFTHVWIVEALPRLGAPAPVLAEVVRVLRPGGHLAIQELVARDAAALALPLVDAARRRAELAAAGLVEIAVRDATTRAHARGARELAARAELARRCTGETLGPVAEARQVLEDALTSGRIGVAQLTARRP
jgi:SAM-dependent methyltransferase